MADDADAATRCGYAMRPEIEGLILATTKPGAHLWIRDEWDTAARGPLCIVRVDTHES